MSDKARFVRADGTLLDGRDAELELARHDAEKMLKELKLDEAEKDKKTKKAEVFEGKGWQMQSSGGPQASSAKGKDSSGHSIPDHDSSESLGCGLPSFKRIKFPLSTSSKQGVAGAQSQPMTNSSSFKTDVRNSLEDAGTSRESQARAEVEEKEMNEKIKGVSSQMEKESDEIWKFSKDAEETVYYFSLNLDMLWNKVSSILDTVQKKINEVGSTVTSVLDHASGQTDSAISMLEKWADMSKNIKDGSELLKGKVKDKTSDVTGFAKNLNDEAQKLAKSANANLNNPLLQNVADMSGVSDAISDMAGTGQYLTDSFTSTIESQSSHLQRIITDASERITAMGESCGLFRFIKDIAGEISHHLTQLSKLIKQIREKVGGLLNKLNGLFEMIYTRLAKLSSIIEGVLGLDMGLMKEALKNGTIRAIDVRCGRVTAAPETEMKTISSTDITGAKVTAGNISAAGVVKDNSKSGHIEAAALDVKAANVDVAIKREGKVKRHLAYLKGANVNVGNVRATAKDDREVETAVAGASAAEVNVGNVVAEGLGKKGTYRHTTAQPSLTVGNIAVGVRRSCGTNVRAGPKFSAFNVDLTVGTPSVTNFLNQLGPGQAFGNIAIPFFGGGGGGEAGGKSSGPEGNGEGEGMTCEPEQDAGFSAARDFAVYGRPGDALPDVGTKPEDYEMRGQKETDKESEGNGKSLDGQSPSTGSTHNVGSGLSKIGGSTEFGNSGEDGTVTRLSSFGGIGHIVKDSLVSVLSEGDGGGNGLDATENAEQGNPGSSTRQTPASTQRQNQQSQTIPSGSSFGKVHSAGAELRRQGSSLGQARFDKHAESLPRLNLKGKAERGSSGFGEEGCNKTPLSSGVYKKGDAAREEDYQSKLAALVKGKVQSQVGKTKSKEEKKSDRKDKKKEKLDNESFKRLLQQECKERLDEAGFYADTTGSTAGGYGGKSGESEAAAGTSEGQEKKVKKPKPKVKPWGEHGNIHGFSTLGTESDKDIKKLGDGIFGFTDG